MDLIQDNQFSHFVGVHFTPHVFIVRPGEDICTRILMFSQEDTHCICVLSGNGAVSNVSLRQVNSVNIRAYEGHFEILSLSGSLLPSDNTPMNRHGGMSISLETSDGTIFGGSIAGLLIAASEVQVVVGSFPQRVGVEFRAIMQRVEAETNVSTAAAIPRQLEFSTTDLNLPAIDPHNQNPSDDNMCNHDDDDDDDDDVVEVKPSNKLASSGDVTYVPV